MYIFQVSDLHRFLWCPSTLAWLAIPSVLILVKVLASTKNQYSGSTSVILVAIVLASCTTSTPATLVPVVPIGACWDVGLGQVSSSSSSNSTDYSHPYNSTSSCGASVVPILALASLLVCLSVPVRTTS